MRSLRRSYTQRVSAASRRAAAAAEKPARVSHSERPLAPAHAAHAPRRADRGRRARGDEPEPVHHRHARERDRLERRRLARGGARAARPVRRRSRPSRGGSSTSSLRTRSPSAWPASARSRSCWSPYSASRARLGRALLEQRLRRPPEGGRRDPRSTPRPPPPARRARARATTGSSFRHWISPTAICTIRSPSRASAPCRRRPTRSRARARYTSRTRNESPNAAVARTCSHIASRRFQKRSMSALSPGCGPEAVESVPVDDQDPAGEHEHQAEQAQRARERRVGPAGRVAPRLDGEHDGAGEHDEREQEVREHHQRVEVEPDRQEPERCLADRAEEDERRHPHGPAGQAGDAVGGDPRDEAEHDREEREGAVAELDRRVRAHGGEERALLAARATTRRRVRIPSAGPRRR